MALDKLVDSAQLDTSLTSVADAIRAKGGTSAQLAFPQGFVDAVEAIETGGGGGTPAWASKISNGNVSFNLQSVVLSDDIVIDFGSLNIDGAYLLNKAGSSKSNTTVEIKCGVLSDLQSCFGYSSTSSLRNIKTVILSCANNPTPSTQFCFNSSVSHILGKPLKAVVLGTGNYRCFKSTSLTEFYLVPNTTTTGGSMDTGVLVDASLVSVANAIKGGLATAETITIVDATTKAKCSTITGTVSQVTDDDETYDFFTQDDSGTVTLADFITTVKGWTLA